VWRWSSRRRTRARLRRRYDAARTIAAFSGRLQGQWPTLRLVHLPVHASWLNQIEIYFSVVQRKVVSPNDITDLAEVEARLLAFERRYRRPRHRSTGASPDPTWTGCCAAWTTTSSSRGPHDHPGRTSGLRSCQVRVKTANRRDP
jgi:hypothetical protein